MRNLTRYDIISYCIKHRYFTNGDVTQYARTQDYIVDNPKQIHEVAVMIWICTNVKEHPCTIEQIENDLKELAKTYD